MLSLRHFVDKKWSGAFAVATVLCVVDWFMFYPGAYHTMFRCVRGGPGQGLCACWAVVSPTIMARYRLRWWARSNGVLPLLTTPSSYTHTPISFSRPFRPILLISKFAKLRRLAATMVVTFVKTVDVTLLFAITTLFFGVLGLQLFNDHE